MKIVAWHGQYEKKWGGEGQIFFLEVGSYWKPSSYWKRGSKGSLVPTASAACRMQSPMHFDRERDPSFPSLRPNSEVCPNKSSDPQCSDCCFKVKAAEGDG